MGNHRWRAGSLALGSVQGSASLGIGLALLSAFETTGAAGEGGSEDTGASDRSTGEAS
jgi:hypothetical protein